RYGPFQRCQTAFLEGRKQNVAIPIHKLQDIHKAMELLSACQGPEKNLDQASKCKYQFGIHNQYQN
ncbi:unnamed protein product, partial [Ranitomeya imitator]